MSENELALRTELNEIKIKLAEARKHINELAELGERVHHLNIVRDVYLRNRICVLEITLICAAVMKFLEIIFTV